MRDFVPFLLLLLLIAVVLRIDFYFTVLYFLAAIWFLSRLWARRARQQVRAGRRFTDRAFVGDEVEVELTVRNDGWLPVPWLEASESLPVQLLAAPFERQAISLGPHESRRFSYRLACRRRGYYPLGPLSVQTGDLLGIERGGLTLGEAQRLTIYPRVVPLRRLGLPTRSPLVALPTRSPLFEDPSRVMGVRDYRRGDSPRRMHWTATARSGRLMVKQYQPAIARETLICLDLNGENYGGRHRDEATELAIVVAASIANHIILRERLPAGLATEAWDPVPGARQQFSLPPRAERAQLMRLLEILARVGVASEASFGALLRRESIGLAWGATLTVITGGESDELLDTLLSLVRRGFTVALVLVGPDPPADGARGGAERLGVPVRRVRHERDLEGW